MKHPGFAAIQAKIAGQNGGNMKKAGAILAAATRKASPAAKKKNPHLKNVPQKGKHGAAARKLKKHAMKDNENVPGEAAMDKRTGEVD